MQITQGSVAVFSCRNWSRESLEFTLVLKKNSAKEQNHPRQTPQLKGFRGKTSHSSPSTHFFLLKKPKPPKTSSRAENPAAQGPVRPQATRDPSKTNSATRVNSPARRAPHPRRRPSTGKRFSPLKGPTPSRLYPKGQQAGGWPPFRENLQRDRIFSGAQSPPAPSHSAPARVSGWGRRSLLALRPVLAVPGAVEATPPQQRSPAPPNRNPRPGLAMTAPPPSLGHLFHQRRAAAWLPGASPGARRTSRAGQPRPPSAGCREAATPGWSSASEATGRSALAPVRPLRGPARG